jgi:glycosyltransferase involved in cell wall biosynthesis
VKVLLCHNFYQQAGGEDQVFADEGRLLESRGHEVLRYTLHNDAINGLSRLSAARKTIWNSESAAEITALVTRERPSVVHFTNTFPLISPSAYYAARRGGAAVVQSLHNYRLLCPNALFLRDGKNCEDCLGRAFAWPSVRHACYRQNRAATGAIAVMQTVHRAAGTWRLAVDRYLVPTEFARAKFIAGGLPAERLCVKPNFIDPDPGAGTGAEPLALFVGRLSEEKGLEPLLHAWRNLGHRRLVIMGDGPQADLAREAAASLPGVEWMGRRPRDEAVAWMGRATCVIVPSVCYEMCPMAIVEAYARGTPVIAPRLGAMASMIAHERTGLHYEPNDTDGLAASVDRLLGDAELQRRLRVAARQEFLDRYSADANYRRLIDVYEQAIAQRTAGRDSRVFDDGAPRALRVSEELGS